AGESTRFQMPFINLGLVPEFGSSVSMPARFGHARAAELFMLAEPFGAARAAELGLVTRVVPDRGMLATATATAQKLVTKASGAWRGTKRLLRQAFIDQLKEAVESENREFAERLSSAEAKEAMSAFLEKRQPNFATLTAAE